MTQLEAAAIATRPPAERALAWIREHNWAIEPSALETIVAIASRELSEDEYRKIEAIQSRPGTQLAGTRTVEMREGGVAIIALQGPIFRYANLFTRFSGATSLEMAALDFSKAVESADVSRIVLTIDSPGGEVSGIHEFAQMVRAARGKKPVTAYVSDKAASAAYWIAAAAERIVIDATASVGSIGVIARVVKGGNENVVEIVSQQSPNKRPDVATDDGRAHVQKYVDRIAQIFVENVAEFRGVESKTVLESFGQGWIVVGADAVAAGMADELGSLESVIAGLAGINKEQRHMTDPKATAPAVTREYIAADHPAIAAAFRDEGKKAGFDEGAKAERERIQGVLSKRRPGHEAIIDRLAFDGKTTPDAAASAVLDAMQAADKTALEKVEKDAKGIQTPASAAADPAKPEGGDPNKNAKSPHQISARAREIVAEKKAKGVNISAAEAVALAEKED